MYVNARAAMRHPTSILCADCSVGKLGICSSFEASLHSGTANVTMARAFKKSERILFGENAKSAALIVHRGCVVTVLEMPDGRQQILDLLTQGDVLLDVEQGDASGFYARAATDVEVCRIPTKAMEQLIDRSPILARSILNTLFHELRRKNAQLAILGQKRSEERIAAFLLDLAHRLVGQGSAPNRVQLPLSRSEISDLLCLTKETVSRSFTHLRDERLIETPRPNEVIIVDRPGLEALAHWARHLET